MSTARLSRQVVYGRNGMVCTNSPLSAAAGLKVLQEGGNAFDAALAVAATETVTMVPMCGIGGVPLAPAPAPITTASKA